MCTVSTTLQLIGRTNNSTVLIAEALLKLQRLMDLIKISEERGGKLNNL